MVNGDGEKNVADLIKITKARKTHGLGVSSAGVDGI